MTNLINVSRNRKAKEWLVILFLTIILFNTIHPFLFEFGISLDRFILLIISFIASYIFEDAIRGFIKGELR